MNNLFYQINPQFVNAAGNNYQLKSTSPAVNAGARARLSPTAIREASRTLARSSMASRCSAPGAGATSTQTISPGTERKTPATSNFTTTRVHRAVGRCRQWHRDQIHQAVVVGGIFVDQFWHRHHQVYRDRFRNLPSTAQTIYIRLDSATGR